MNTDILGRKPVPLDDIGSCVTQLMDLAIKNGANSISMPDEYVSVFHFVCYPQEYYIPK